MVKFAREQLLKQIEDADADITAGHVEIRITAEVIPDEPQEQA